MAVLVEALVLGFPVPSLVNGAQLQAQDGTLAVPAITGPIRSHQAVTAVVAAAADGTVVACSAPSRYPPGRAAASELPALAAPGNVGLTKHGSLSTPYRSVLWMVWPAGHAGIRRPPPPDPP